MARKLVVEIVGDASKLNRAFRDSSRDAKRFEAQITGLNRGIGRAFAFGAGGFTAGRFFTDAIGAASDLNEQLSKTQQVFGQSASDVQSWAQMTTQAFGISRREALATASSFGALFQPMGIVGTQAAVQSEKLTELGADLASFYNTDVSDALQAIRSGVVGESEPLRRYGVLLSETRVQAQALADTHKQSAKDLTAAEKAAARIALIFRDTSKASGDFARTSEGLANQSRQLRAELDDLKTNIGQYYVPGLTRLAKAANDVFKTFSGAAQEQAAASADQRTRAALIPRLAEDFGRLKAEGVSSAEAAKRLTEELGGTGKAALLVGDAINYFAGGKTREGITKLRIEVKQLGVDAETTAKLVSLAAVHAAQQTAAAAAAAARGMAALTPGAQAGIGLAEAGLTVGTTDDLRALQRQHELNQRAAEFARARLAGATGNAASRWAETLRRVLDRDASVLGQIRSIQADNAAKVKAAADAQRETNRRASELAAQVAENRITRQRGWLDFAAERAGATKTIRDDVKAYRQLERWLQARIRQEGRTLELVRDLWQTRQKIRDLNKQKASDGDPLAGLMQVSSKRLAAILAAGTGLDAAGRRTLAANIAGAEIQPLHVHVEIDGREVGHAVTRQQARDRHRTARQTSGWRG